MAQSIKTTIFNFIRSIFTIYPMERLLLYFVRGSEYQGFRYKFIPGASMYKPGSLRNVNRNGINYSLDISCLMQWYVYWDFKAKDRDCLYSLIRQGDIVFDIGTNIGETLLNFAKLTGTNGFVYGFEPDNENYTNVSENIVLNNFKNIHVFKKAVSDRIETVKLYCVDTHNRGMNRILPDEETESASYIVLETTTLDNIMQENKIPKVDVMKIDIEGYEMHALSGAVDTLKKFKPSLFIEVGYTRLIKNNSHPVELIKLLEGLGYKIFHSQTDEQITSGYDFSYLGDGGIDVYAKAEKSEQND